MAIGVLANTFLALVPSASGASQCEMRDMHQVGCGSSQICSIPDGAKTGTCVHKFLLPLSGADISTTAAIAVAGVLAVVSGVGGGGLYVPLLLLFENFDSEHAVPLSKAMILVGAIVANVSMFRSAQSPLDLAVCLILLPSCLAGTVVGVFLNVLLPSWAVAVVLTLVLCASGMKAWSKALDALRSEFLATGELPWGEPISLPVRACFNEFLCRLLLVPRARGI
jgi:hypothetical protein